MSANIKLATYIVSGTVSAAVIGALLGMLGSLVSDDTRAAISALGASVAIIVGLLEAAGRQVPLPQMDRETPYRWLRPGPIQWALRNGTALGIGARSRLGFWLWYVIPVGAFVSGEPLIGAVGFGLYGMTRTSSARGIAVLDAHFNISTERLLRFSLEARRVTAIQLVIVGISAIIAVG